MSAIAVDRVLSEFAHVRAADPEQALEAVRLALLIEDVFGITLTDAQIEAGLLCDAETLPALVARAVASR